MTAMATYDKRIGNLGGNHKRVKENWPSLPASEQGWTKQEQPIRSPQLLTVFITLSNYALSTMHMHSMLRVLSPSQTEGAVLYYFAWPFGVHRQKLGGWVPPQPHFKPFITISRFLSHCCYCAITHKCVQYTYASPTHVQDNRAHTCTHTHTFMHTHMHAHTHARTHTCTQAHSPILTAATPIFDCPIR